MWIIHKEFYEKESTTTHTCVFRILFANNSVVWSMLTNFEESVVHEWLNKTPLVTINYGSALKSSFENDSIFWNMLSKFKFSNDRSFTTHKWFNKNESTIRINYTFVFQISFTNDSIFWSVLLKSEEWVVHELLNKKKIHQSCFHIRNFVRERLGILRRAFKARRISCSRTTQ